MTVQVTGLWRFPIKSHGREALEQVTFRSGECLPWDRAWAVAHEQSRAGIEEWSPCAAFTRVAGAPKLAAITADLDETRGAVTLRHPDRPDLTFQPDSEAQAFLDWVTPLMPDGRAMPARIVRVPGRGMTDASFPSVTLCSMASHRQVEARIGQKLSIHRWRGNVWIDGLEPWAEFDWIGKDLRIGEATFRVVERTERCLATTANPETGERDADTLGTLDSWGHRDFSVQAEVTHGGAVATGDAVEVL
ncbi:MOSC domain-containing protein [Pseudoruegeria sp. HB172150]|uniref:MOSC domain-containing protein n=1 Tax=Pseudoruegeria sp. HB172150 TaxID=2721164 RepID=UPI001555A882|nr:MOSC N-terminal beta barrel domain-containing protein [Pseudoruegeria sp. HB172150]